MQGDASDLAGCRHGAARAGAEQRGGCYAVGALLGPYARVASLTTLGLCVTVPGPCDPEDLIDGIIFAANYLGSTQLLSDKTPSKNVRMMQAQEAVSRIKVSGHEGWMQGPELSSAVSPRLLNLVLSSGERGLGQCTCQQF